MLLKDPYVLDFLELNDHYLEKDLEDAILRDLEAIRGGVFRLLLGKNA
jgi:predicted nuclease of restriction endonuclease-like (RecB) superfamily